MPDSEQERLIPDFSHLHLWKMSESAGKQIGFHMPGHAGARFFSREYAERLIGTDTTELSSSDDLHHPTGPALMAMKESSRIYGSGETLFVTTGSTTGIHVMLASTASPEAFLLIPRTVHMSVMHALALLGLKYAFIPFPENGEDDLLFPQLTAEVLTRALDIYPQATDVLVVSPDYYGKCADIAALANSAHSRGARLLVDEAHGAHFAFAGGICPADAMYGKADMCVQSLHKTLPALTMASQLHISAEAVSSRRVLTGRVWEMLRVFETSSPSFLIAASSEYAISWMDMFGRKAIETQAEAAASFSRKIAPLLGEQTGMTCHGTDGRDPLRLVLTSDSPGIFMPRMVREFEEKGIFAEFSDLRRMVLIVSPWQNPDDFDRLYDAVRMYCSRKPRDAFFNAVHADRRWGRLLVRVPERVFHVRDAVFGGRSVRKAAPAEAVGRVSASAIVPYPPGIPLLWPGERIGEEHMRLVTEIMELGVAVNGVAGGKIDVFDE